MIILREGKTKLSPPQRAGAEEDIPGLRSCCPRRRHLPWRIAPACARHPRRCPRWTPQPAAAPAAAGCDCGHGPRAAQSADLQGKHRLQGVQNRGIQCRASTGCRGWHWRFQRRASRAGTHSRSVSPGAGTQGGPAGTKGWVLPANLCCLQVLITQLKLSCPWSVWNKPKVYQTKASRFKCMGL